MFGSQVAYLDTGGQALKRATGFLQCLGVTVAPDHQLVLRMLRTWAHAASQPAAVEPEAAGDGAATAAATAPMRGHSTSLAQMNKLYTYLDERWHEDTAAAADICAAFVHHPLLWLPNKAAANTAAAQDEADESAAGDMMGGGYGGGSRSRGPAAAGARGFGARGAVGASRLFGAQLPGSFHLLSDCRLLDNTRVMEAVEGHKCEWNGVAVPRIVARCADCWSC